MVQVYLFRGKHPLYESLVSHPPEGVEYLPKLKPSGVEEYSLYGSSHSMLRRSVDGTFKVLGTPRFVPILRDYDLVHSSRGFFVLGRNRYVVDFEHVVSFLGMDGRRLHSPKLCRLVGKGMASSNCRGVLPHCEAARRTLGLVTEDRSVLEKTTVVYPTVDVSLCRAQRVKNEVPRILFIGEYYWKGGREVLDACAKLARKQDFELSYISLRVHPPDGVLKKARESMRLEYVKGPIPRNELFEKEYARADLFVMPTYLDTFGYAFLEAMAFGIPCIGAVHFAVPEIIENEASGLLVRPPVSYFDSKGYGHPELMIEQLDSSQMTDELALAIDRLLSSAALREKMGAHGLREVTTGKFSIPRRNALLKTIYESSLTR